jgi:threonine dehydrogenase-like Zn-dependent dehydrogenase
LASTARCASPSVLLIGAKYAHQQRLARELGGTEALAPEQLPRAVRRHARSLSYGGRPGLTATLSGGADVVFDCVGSPESIAQSLGMVRPRGTVSLVGMPGKVTIDLAPLWHREVRLAGAYAYGTETVAELDAGTGTTPTFDIAFEVAAATGVGRLVSATYPLTRFEEAVAHAGNAGRRGAVKIAFDLSDQRQSQARRQSQALEQRQARSQRQAQEQRGRARPR